MSFSTNKRVIFPFLSLSKASTKRPLVWLFLENPHNPENKGLRFPALIDTGADRSVVPHYMCKELGHDFDAGYSPSTIGGIGNGRFKTVTHSVRLTILETPPNGRLPKVDDAVFFPIDMQMGFVEQKLPFILLGQSDFLHLFRYCQNRSKGEFSLRRLAT